MSLQWKKDDLPTLAEKKNSMVAETCQKLIYNGIDVELSTGTEHLASRPTTRPTSTRCSRP